MAGASTTGFELRTNAAIGFMERCMLLTVDSRLARQRNFAVQRVVAWHAEQA